MLVAVHLCRSCFWSNTRPACTGRSPQNSNNPITHSSLSLPLSIAMQAALFWGSVGKKRERTARSTPGSQKKKKTPTLRRMRWHCAAMERPITRAIGYLPPLDASHQGLGRRTRTSIDRWQCMPHATLTHDDTRRNLPNAPSTTPENQVGTLLARPSVLTRGPAGPRLSRGSARQSAELHCTLPGSAAAAAARRHSTPCPRRFGRARKAQWSGQAPVVRTCAVRASGATPASRPRFYGRIQTATTVPA